MDIKSLTPDQLRQLRGQIASELQEGEVDLLRCPGLTERDEYGNQIVVEECDYTHTTHAATCPKHGIHLV